jgi:hypothetical protein
MMKTLDSYEFPAKGAGKSRYDWNAILSGAIVQLDKVDFGNDGMPKNFGAQCRINAAKRGMRVRLSLDHDKVVAVVQAYPKDDNAATPTDGATAKGRRGRK